MFSPPPREGPLVRVGVKHGVNDEDAIAVAGAPVVAGPLDDENHTQALLLETVILVWDDGTEALIHAMKCRPQYLEILD